MSNNCPNCRGHRAKHRISAKDFDSGRKDFDLLSCPDCGLVRTSLRPTEAELDACYSTAYYGKGQGKFLPQLEGVLNLMTRRRARFLLGLLPPPLRKSPRVLDVGCGRAMLLKAMAGLGAECHGLERLGFDTGPEDPEIAMHLGAIESLSFGQNQFQLIVIWHVLEHLEQPRKVIEQLAALLSPGGVMAVSVPNIDSLQARLFGANWFHLDLPRHLWHFSPGSLASLWRPFGFDEVRSTGFSIEQNPFGFIQSFLNRWTSPPPNRLYRSMRGDRDHKLLAWLLPAACLLPLALLESLLFASVRLGATHTIYLRKTD